MDHQRSPGIVLGCLGCLLLTALLVASGCKGKSGGGSPSGEPASDEPGEAPPTPTVRFEGRLGDPAAGAAVDDFEILARDHIRGGSMVQLAFATPDHDPPLKPEVTIRCQAAGRVYVDPMGVPGTPKVRTLGMGFTFRPLPARPSACEVRVQVDTNRPGPSEVVGHACWKGDQFTRGPCRWESLAVPADSIDVAIEKAGFVEEDGELGLDLVYSVTAASSASADAVLLARARCAVGADVIADAGRHGGVHGVAPLVAGESIRPRDRLFVDAGLAGAPERCELAVWVGSAFDKGAHTADARRFCLEAGVVRPGECTLPTPAVPATPFAVQSLKVEAAESGRPGELIVRQTIQRGRGDVGLYEAQLVCPERRPRSRSERPQAYAAPGDTLHLQTELHGAPSEGAACRVVVVIRPPDGPEQTLAETPWP